MATTKRTAWHQLVVSYIRIIPARLCLFFFRKSIAKHLVDSNQIKLIWTASSCQEIYGLHIRNPDERNRGIKVITEGLKNHPLAPIEMIAIDKQEGLKNVLTKKDRVHEFYYVLYHLKSSDNPFLEYAFQKAQEQFTQINPYEHATKPESVA